VRITSARWLTSKEEPIHGVGLAPDIAVASATGGADPALDRAVQYLLTGR
jgi:C-terminal processing protease CtpA/Prc